MLARASGANSFGCVPAFEVNTKSTAYSGSTAISARTASASPAEMSSCTTSAPQPSRNAAPTIARPKHDGRDPVNRVYAHEADEDAGEGDQPGGDERETRSGRAARSRTVGHGADPRGATATRFPGQEEGGGSWC